MSSSSSSSSKSNSSSEQRQSGGGSGVQLKMASDNEASCVTDPNFAVICSFIEQFGKYPGLEAPDIATLQNMIENSQESKSSYQFILSLYCISLSFCYIALSTPPLCSTHHSFFIYLSHFECLYVYFISCSTLKLELYLLLIIFFLLITTLPLNNATG